MSCKIGDIVEGEITGIQPYGAFVKCSDGYGLIHISEISKDYIKDIHAFLTLNQKVRVKVLGVDEQSSHFKLSLKALQPSSLSKERRRRHRNVALPKMNIGFKTLDEKLEQWIEEADH